MSRCEDLMHYSTTLKPAPLHTYIPFLAGTRRVYSAELLCVDSWNILASMAAATEEEERSSGVGGGERLEEGRRN